MRWILFLLVLPFAFSDVINIDSSMTDEEAYSAIESAQAGDVVQIAPGTYQFRVYLDNNGTPENPIMIRSDPEDRAVFDYEGKPCDQWPGSSRGKLDYWAWQIQGSNIHISDIEIRGAYQSSSVSSAAIFMGPNTIYAEPTPEHTIPENIVLRNVRLVDNQEGLQGTAENTLVEFSEIARNGDTSATRPRHNLYLQGGSITVRYSHIHHATSAHNLHLRTHTALFENNLIEQPKAYTAQFLTNKAQQVNGEDYLQTFTFIGNIIKQTETHSHNKVFELINSNNYEGASQRLNLYYNTIIVGAEDIVALLYDRTGTKTVEAYMYNNIFVGTEKPYWMSETTKPFLVDIQDNWWQDADYSSYDMSYNIYGADPGLNDFVPHPGSEVIGKANQSLGILPAWEYYRDFKYRERQDALDIGAAESTTDSEIISYTGEYTPPPCIPVDEICGNGIDEDCENGDAPCICEGPDLNHDNSLDSEEMISAIAIWREGGLGLRELMQSIDEWKEGCI